MGYMGLSCVCDSDRASDLRWQVFGAMTKALREGLKEKGNMYNTSGPVNVALFIEEYVKPEDFHYQEDMFNLVKDTKAKLEVILTVAEDIVWPNAANKKMHLKAYNRLIRCLDNFLETVEQ